MVWGGLHSFLFFIFLELIHVVGLTKLCTTNILPVNSES